MTSAGVEPAPYFHRFLPSGVEFAADVLPERRTVALIFRMLTGLAEEPGELAGVASIVERTLSKGTQQFDGRGLADAFDALGAQWGTGSGRQSMSVRVLCLPDFVTRVVALVAEMICRPTFPDDACRVAVRLAQEQLRHMEDSPQDVVQQMIHELSLGPVLGRHVAGTLESLERITPDAVREHWRRTHHAGRLQVAAAGPIDADALAAALDAGFTGLGRPAPEGRGAAAVERRAARAHRDKDLKQQYIMMALPGVPKGHPQYATEQVLLGVLSGGMSGRLFTEVREKLGLVYWVGAWSEQARGSGALYVGASTTPERCDQTYATLRRELVRLGEDVTEEEVRRARDGLIAHAETEDDLTRSRAGGLSDDLFHFSRPIGLEAKLADVRRVTLEDVADYARRLNPDDACVATLGPRAL